jgi:uncharacterized phage protein gp47/JayE
MAYFAPTITAAGLSVPVFNDIQEALLQSYRSAYGSTVYLGNDAADYQWITTLSLKVNDAMGLCQLAYNARSPFTAIGADLDSVLKLNGITRNTSNPSTAVLVLSGVSKTTVTNGVVSDSNGNLWSLPYSVTIGTSGTVSVTATCQQLGPIAAAAGTITTPAEGFTAGWLGVTNPDDAVVGTPVESDSTLRARQSISVALPSSTRLAGTTAEVKAVAGVARVNILENQTSVTDSYGNESHSLTCVVEGGTDLAVATAIFTNRGIGPNTLGATATFITEIPVTDPNSGNVTTIGFIRPTYVPIYINITTHPLTAAFTTATQAAIVNALVAYLGSLDIGESVSCSALISIAMSQNASLSTPSYSVTSMTIGTSPSPSGTSDISFLFYQVAEGLSSNINLTVA